MKRVRDELGKWKFVIGLGLGAFRDPHMYVGVALMMTSIGLKKIAVRLDKVADNLTEK